MKALKAKAKWFLGKYGVKTLVTTPKGESRATVLLLPNFSRDYPSEFTGGVDFTEVVTYYLSGEELTSLPVGATFQVKEKAYIVRSSQQIFFKNQSICFTGAVQSLEGGSQNGA